MNIKEQIEEIYEDYGQIHERECDLNSEDCDGCNCAIKSMVMEMVKSLTEYFSHDITFDSEEQRKAAVELYLSQFND